MKMKKGLKLIHKVIKYQQNGYRSQQGTNVKWSVSMLHKIRRIWIQFSRNHLKFTQNFTFQNSKLRYRKWRSIKRSVDDTQYKRQTLNVPKKTSKSWNEKFL